ncbi:MAG: hypothetical protein AB7F64_00325 [Gammaproteobacteria bacterium]
MAGNTQTLKHKFSTEIKVYFMYAFFIALFVGAITTYKRLVLNQYAISYANYGYGIIEGLILAKIVIIGQKLKLGERFHDRPLIIPVIYKTILFTIFVFIFTIIEEIVVGLIKHEKWNVIFHFFIGLGLYELFAKLLLMFIFFLLFFAFLELGRVIGRRKLYELFFRGIHT